MELRLEQEPPSDAFALDGIHETGREEGRVSLEVRGELGRAVSIASEYGIVDLEVPPVTLEEIFLDYYGPGSE